MSTDVPNVAVPLKQASIVQLDMVNDDFAVAVFSNGDAIKVESEKLRHFVLTSGSQYVSAADNLD